MLDFPEGMLLVPEMVETMWRLPRARPGQMALSAKSTMRLMDVFLCCRELIEPIIVCIVALEEEEEE